jgi:hypothetical protein
VDSTGLKTVVVGEGRDIIGKGRKSWFKIHIAYDSRKIYQEIKERSERNYSAKKRTLGQ